MLATVVALYNAVGLTSPTLSAKGVKKWLSHAERGDTAAALKTGAGAGVVYGATAETKVKQH